MKPFIFALIAGGLSLPIYAQDKAIPAPVSAASAATQNTQANSNTPESKTSDEKLPPLVPPRLASMQVRVTGDQFLSIVEARERRDLAIQAILERNLKGDVSGGELGPIAEATSAIYRVCNIGSDYIQYRLEKNGKGLGWLSFFSGLFAAGSATTAVINSAKGFGLTSAALQNYKSGVIENGDSGHNNTELKKILEDVKFELAMGISNHNKALLMPSTSKLEKANQYRHLQASVIEMHNACAFF